jgi:hypothetical protein
MPGNKKKSFSVLTVSKRTGWEHKAYRSVGRQTALPEKWVIVSELMSETLPPLNTGRYGILWKSAPRQTRLSNLNASLNAGLRLIDTDYVIFYQDFIELKEDCFDKLLELVTPTTLVTTCTPNYDGSDDGRYTGCDSPRRCRPEEWEANVSIAPMGVIRELGGFDERLDSGWSWDNALLARKAAMLGAKFICDESNRPKLYPHEMSSHNTLPKNGQLCERIIHNIRSGKEPINCGCL